MANANPATFSDPTGDSGTAPDITGVVVSNKATQITFRINVVKLVVPSDGHLLIAIDTDHNTSTGYNGSDYAFLGDLSTNSFDVGRWNGTDFVTTNEPTATASTDPTGLTFSISPTDVSCAARAGTAALKARAIVGEGPAAGCAWLLPKRSRGKTLHASVTAALDGASVTRKFTTRIK